VTGPLAHLVVLDLSRVLAGPWHIDVANWVGPHKAGVPE
jgi:hypothetical protein